MQCSKFLENKGIYVVQVRVDNLIKNKNQTFSNQQNSPVFIKMISYSWDTSNQETQDFSVKMYNRKSSQTFLEDNQEKQSWHQEFPDFIFLKELSTTISSTVWLVKDQRDQRQYAGKIIQRIGKQSKERSHQENQLEFLSKIHLQNCVKTYQIQVSLEFYLIVMEYLQKGDLASYLTNFVANNMLKYSTQHMTWVKSSFRQIVMAVNELHKNGYIHRDLKPQNFLIDNFTANQTIINGLKLNDFGLVIKQKTEDSLFCGTPEYMAPERLDNKKWKLLIESSSDMWSLGIILFELITGQVPYQESGRQEILQLIYSNFIEFDSQVDEQLKKLVMQLLQINPSKRITMEQLLKHPYLQDQQTQQILN